MGFSDVTNITHANLLLDSLGGAVTRKVTVARDTVNKKFSRGALLGKITKGAWAVAAAVAAGAGEAGANTGTGTCTKDVTLAYLANVMLGAYKVVVTRAYVAQDTVAGAYEVYAPNGVYLGSGTIGDTWAKHIKFVLAEAGAEKFIVGDAFTLTVTRAAGTGFLAAFAPTADDGTEIPYGILGNDVDVNAANSVGAFVYLRGKFDINQVSVLTGVTLANYIDACRDKEIYLVDVQDEI